MRRYEKALGILAKGIRVLDWDHADIVIVGNGIAGLTAALEARRLAPEKRISVTTPSCLPREANRMACLTLYLDVTLMAYSLFTA